MSDKPYRTWAVFALFKAEDGDDRDGWHNIGGSLGGPYTGPEAIRKALTFIRSGPRWAFALELKDHPLYDLYYPVGQESPLPRDGRAAWGIYTPEVDAVYEEGSHDG